MIDKVAACSPMTLTRSGPASGAGLRKGCSQWTWFSLP